MSLQKYRADEAGPPDANGATPHYALWIGGPTLAKVTLCPSRRNIIPPRTVYVTGEPDTWFSHPAATRYRGRTIRGYLTTQDGNWVFHPYRDSFAPKSLQVSITYDIVSEASAKVGDTADNGYISPDEERKSITNGRKREIERNQRQSRRGAYNWTLGNALDFLSRHDAAREPEAQRSGDQITVRVFGEYDPDCSAGLQATHTLHLQGNLSAGTWTRLARLLESRGAKFY